MLYLISVVPLLWVLEMDEIERARLTSGCSETEQVNQTSILAFIERNAVSLSIVFKKNLAMYVLRVMTS